MFQPIPGSWDSLCTEPRLRPTKVMLLKKVNFSLFLCSFNCFMGLLVIILIM